MYTKTRYQFTYCPCRLISYPQHITQLLVTVTVTVVIVIFVVFSLRRGCSAGTLILGNMVIYSHLYPLKPKRYTHSPSPSRNT
jgi:hypothetical protein